MTPANPLRVAFARNHPEELAALLAGRGREDLLDILGSLPADVGAAVLARLPPGTTAALLAAEDAASVASWVGRAALEDALTLLLQVAPERRPAILERVPLRHMRRTLESLVIYPRRTAGALVDPGVARVGAGLELAQAVELLRADQTHVNQIWVVDSDGRYVGLLDVGRALLSRSARQPVGELAARVEPLRAETALAAARDLDAWLHHPELPVVDHQNHLLGALSQQRLMAALAAEAPQQHGLIDGIGTVTESYFRFLGACLGELLAARSGAAGSRRPGGDAGRGAVSGQPPRAS